MVLEIANVKRISDEIKMQLYTPLSLVLKIVYQRNLLKWCSILVSNMPATAVLYIVHSYVHSGWYKHFLEATHFVAILHLWGPMAVFFRVASLLLG